MARKRRDRRFTDPEGNEWDSQFEYLVFVGLPSHGYRVRRCDERDSVSYQHPVKQGACLECGSHEVVQVRSYTPDLFVVDALTDTDEDGTYIECKGYFPADRRAQLRSVVQSNPQLDLRILFAAERKLTKAKTNIEYVHSYIKCGAGVWNKGALEWR